MMIDFVETCPNPHGICVLNKDVLASPSANIGEIRIKSYLHDTVANFKAHEASLSVIAFNDDATQIATSSETGTLIRIWDTKDGTKIKEVR